MATKPKSKKPGVKKAKPRKLDPNQEFVVMRITREDVAGTLNDLIESGIIDEPEFADDDPRLTDEVCEAFANGQNSAICDTDEVVDREGEYNTGIARSYFKKGKGMFGEDDDG